MEWNSSNSIWVQKPLPNLPISRSDNARDVKDYAIKGFFKDIFFDNKDRFRLSFC